MGATVQSLLQPCHPDRWPGLNLLSSLPWVLSITIISFYPVKDAERLRQFLTASLPAIPRNCGGCEKRSTTWKAFFAAGGLARHRHRGLDRHVHRRLPNAGAMGVIAGLLEVVPTFGPVLATIPAVLIALRLGPSAAEQLRPAARAGPPYPHPAGGERHLVPRIMGRRMQLHPVIIFIGVLAGGFLAGTLGVLLAAPVIGTLRVLLRYTYAKLLDRDPFPHLHEARELGEVYPGEIDAILFDLDGTLIKADEDAVRSLADRLESVRWLLRRRDPALVARRMIATWESPANSVLSFLERVGLDDGVLDLGQRLYRLRALETPHNFHAVEGVVDTPATRAGATTWP